MDCWQEACRDARLVRPFRFSVDKSTSKRGGQVDCSCNAFACQLVYSSTVLERTHEPCVPTRLLPANHFLIELIIKVKVQNSKFKIKVPTCLLLTNYLVIQLILKFKIQCSKFKVKNLNVQSQNLYMPKNAFWMINSYYLCKCPAARNKRKTNAHGADFRHGKAIYSLTKILIHET